MNNKDLWIYALKLHVYTTNCLRDLSIYNINFKIWQQKTNETLQMAFGYKSDRAQRFKNIRYHPNKNKMQGPQTPAEMRQAYLSGLDEATALLEESIKLLNGSNDGSCITADVAAYLERCSVPAAKQQDILKRLNALNASVAQENSNSSLIEIQKNMLATFLNNIIMENEVGTL